jgi:SAM-dependent methyltransferase
MGVKLERKKKNPLWISILYKLKALLPLSKKQKLKLFLNIEWLFDRFAIEASFDYYPVEKHPFRTNTQAFILDFIKPESSVLDLGCGLGFVSFYVSEKAEKVVGIDYNKGDIAKAQSLFQRNNLEYWCEDALIYLQNKGETFDILLLSHILEHIEEPENFLKTFKDFFQYIFIELPDFDKTLLNPVRKDLNMPLIYSDADHVVEFDREELKALFQRCHLTILQSEYRFGLQRYWCSVNDIARHVATEGV